MRPALFFDTRAPLRHLGATMAAQTTQDLPPLLTAAEVCRQFRTIERHLLYRLAHRGEIPFVRIGKRGYRFSLSDLRAWIAAGGSRGGSIR